MTGNDHRTRMCDPSTAGPEPATAAPICSPGPDEAQYGNAAAASQVRPAHASPSPAPDRAPRAPVAHPDCVGHHETESARTPSWAADIQERTPQARSMSEAQRAATQVARDRGMCSSAEVDEACLEDLRSTDEGAALLRASDQMVGEREAQASRQRQEAMLAAPQEPVATIGPAPADGIPIDQWQAPADRIAQDMANLTQGGPAASAAYGIGRARGHDQEQLSTDIAAGRATWDIAGAGADATTRPLSREAP